MSLLPRSLITRPQARPRLRCLHYDALNRVDQVCETGATVSARSLVAEWRSLIAIRSYQTNGLNVEGVAHSCNGGRGTLQRGK
jgi:hypothetical protein